MEAAAIMVVVRKREGVLGLYLVTLLLLALTITFSAAASVTHN
jgi:hypothetical protein